MSGFSDAVEIILHHEGGDSYHPSDPGGLTRYGISSSAYPKLDIRNLSLEQAKGIYLSDFWLRCGCDRLPYPLALGTFDAAVNCGVLRASRWLQSALNVLADGAVGPKTIAAADKLDADGIDRALIDMTALRCRHYATLEMVGTFGRGWFRRTLETFRAALDAADQEISHG